jgi:hypothetical protein
MIIKVAFYILTLAASALYLYQKKDSIKSNNEYMDKPINDSMDVIVENTDKLQLESTID